MIVWHNNAKALPFGEGAPEGGGRGAPEGHCFSLIEEKHLFRHGLRRATFPRGEGIAPTALSKLNNHLVALVKFLLRKSEVAAQ